MKCIYKIKELYKQNKFLSVGKYLVKIMLNVCSRNNSNDDKKIFLIILEEAEAFNHSELINRFNYNKLTVDILSCQLMDY